MLKIPAGFRPIGEVDFLDVQSKSLTYRFLYMKKSSLFRRMVENTLNRAIIVINKVVSGSCPGGLMDKIADSGSADAGSIPARDARINAWAACTFNYTKKNYAGSAHYCRQDDCLKDSTKFSCKAQHNSKK